MEQPLPPPHLDKQIYQHPIEAVQIYLDLATGIVVPKNKPPFSDEEKEEYKTLAADIISHNQFITREDRDWYQQYLVWLSERTI